MSADTIVAKARAKYDAMEQARKAGMPAVEIEARRNAFMQAIDEAERATRTVRVCPLPEKWHQFWRLSGHRRSCPHLYLLVGFLRLIRTSWNGSQRS
jgi:hypothetical protein